MPRMNEAYGLEIRVRMASGTAAISASHCNYLQKMGLFYHKCVFRINCMQLFMHMLPLHNVSKTECTSANEWVRPSAKIEWQRQQNAAQAPIQCRLMAQYEIWMRQSCIACVLQLSRFCLLHRKGWHELDLRDQRKLHCTDLRARKCERASWRREATKADASTPCYLHICVCDCYKSGKQKSGSRFTEMGDDSNFPSHNVLPSKRTMEHENARDGICMCMLYKLWMWHRRNETKSNAIAVRAEPIENMPDDGIQRTNEKTLENNKPAIVCIGVIAAFQQNGICEQCRRRGPICVSSPCESAGSIDIKQMCQIGCDNRNEKRKHKTSAHKCCQWCELILIS